MNIEQAKLISIVEILETIGMLPQRETGTDAMYLSPIRLEHTGSFHVDKVRNLWFDFGLNIGGDILNFVSEYLKYHKEHYTTKDALRWIEIMSGNAPRIKPILKEHKENEKSLVIKEVEPLTHPALFNYLGKRGIDLHIAMKYLEQVTVFNRNTSKTFTCIGFKNDNDGFELRNRNFKGCAGSKYITFVRGTVPKPPTIHIFEGPFDFLTFLTIKKNSQLADDTIVLNSLVCLDKATPYIYGYGYKKACTWMDNDVQGKLATKSIDDFLKTQDDLLHVPVNRLYLPHKDVNSWHMHNLNLKL